MFNFVTPALFKEVVVIGCGGTGSRVVPPLCQLMKSMSWNLNPVIHLVDDDIVEEKNLIRQNFCRADVGKNKAVVLAERYSNAFELEVRAYPFRITESVVAYHAGLSNSDITDQHRLLHSAINRPVIVFLCVDSVQARKDILTLLQLGSHTDTVIIDAGNGDIFGQVTVFNNRASGINHSGFYPTKLDSIFQDKNTPTRLEFFHPLPYLPFDVQEYETMKDNPGQSCTDLDQTLAVNSMMASCMLGVAQNLLMAIPIDYRKIRLSLNGSNTTVLWSMPELMRIWKSNTEYLDEVATKYPTSTSVKSLSSHEKLRLHLLVTHQIMTYVTGPSASEITKVSRESCIGGDARTAWTLFSHDLSRKIKQQISGDVAVAA